MGGWGIIAEQPSLLDLHRSFSHNQFVQVPASTQEIFIKADNRFDTLLNRSYLHDKIRNTLKFMSIKSKNSLNTHPAGFTLIEVMIAVAVEGILVLLDI